MIYIEFMTLSLGTNLWDKPEAILSFNENNTIINDKLQKAISDYCKSQLTTSYSQKKLFEKFRNENDVLNKSEYSFSSHTYFLSDQVCDIISTQETFSDAFLNEIDEIIKIKIANIKKETKILKNEKKKLFDDLAKENQKLNNDFKNYHNRYNLKDFAQLAAIRAEDNKALSRNQVEEYQSIYLTRQSQYQDARNSYMKTLESFNSYQKKFYSSLMADWGLKAQSIENQRYNVLKATFTNLSELCKSVASKFNEIADRIESKTDTIECEKDYLTLINQEKTGDVPPGDVPFKDFDLKPTDLDSIEDPVRPKLSNNSGSDSTSSNNDHKKAPTLRNIKNAKSLSRSVSGTSDKENSATMNGSSKTGSRFFSKLFGGSKKSKESPVQVTPSKVQNLESLVEEKCAQNSDSERLEEVDQVEDKLKTTPESLNNDYCDIKKSDSKKRMSLFRSTRQQSCTASFDTPNDRAQKSRSIFRKMGRNGSNPFGKHRSKSVSSIVVDTCDTVNEGEQNQSMCPQKPPRLRTLERKFSKPKISHRSSTSRSKVDGVHSLTIEVQRPECPVEIVSTPAEAMAIVARSSCIVASSASPSSSPVHSESQLVSIDNNDNDPAMRVHSYEYYYTGSCVAIHDYESTDISTMYLSFCAGQQFYIVKEDNATVDSGWLFVETVDRSKSGYVPTNYMNTRLFDTHIRMLSHHPEHLST